MAVTAFPVILVDSTAGGASDTAASGAGPATALTGTGASTDTGTGATMIVTLDAGTDLTNVAVDGSHVLYLADATAGHRRFAAINAKAGSGGATPTVTVEQAFTVSLTGKSWAIGGTRATVASAASVLLFNNNNASGDAMPGWAVEMQSGHNEVLSTNIVMRRAGDTTGGPITLRGAASAPTPPLLRATSNLGTLVTMNTGSQVCRDFGLSAESATIAAAIAGAGGGGVNNQVISGVKVTGTSTNKFTTGLISQTVLSCNVSNCVTGIGLPDAGVASCNYVHGCSGVGVSMTGTGGVMFGNIVVGCGSDGIQCAATTAGTRTVLIAHNTVDNNTGSGLKFTATLTAGISPIHVVNNIFSNNGAYGVNFSSGSPTAATIAGSAVLLLNNDTYNNTSGPYSPASVGENDPGLNPTFTNSAAGNFAIGTNLKAKGYPVGGTLFVGTTSSTYSYVDPGAAQRQEAGGAAGMLYIPNLDGV